MKVKHWKKLESQYNPLGTPNEGTGDPVAEQYPDTASSEGKPFQTAESPNTHCVLLYHMTLMVKLVKNKEKDGYWYNAAKYI